MKKKNISKTIGESQSEAFAFISKTLDEYHKNTSTKEELMEEIHIKDQQIGILEKQLGMQKEIKNKLDIFEKREEWLKELVANKKDNEEVVATPLVNTWWELIVFVKKKL